MELKQLRSYCAVVKYNSFTKAAEKLYLSQPTVSAHIRQLEEEFQSQLILRTTKSIQLTHRGQELYECAQNMVHLQNNLLRSWNDEDRKIIHIGASTIPSTYILPELLPAFRKKEPEIQFHVTQGNTQAIVDGLLCGAYDVGLIGADPHRESLSVTPFFRDQMVLITPVNDEFKAFSPAEEIPLREICSRPVLLRENGSGSKKSITAYLEANGIEENALTVAARLNDQESIMNLVAAGLGISIVSRKAAERAVKEGRLLAFPLPGGGSGRELYIALRTGAFLSQQTRKFISYAENFYK